MFDITGPDYIEEPDTHEIAVRLGKGLDNVARELKSEGALA